MKNPEERIRELEAELSRLRARVAELEGEGTVARTRLRRARRMEVFQRVAAGAVHDFNNLLVGVRNLADVIRLSAPEGSELRAQATTLATAGRQVFEVTRALLAMVRRRPGDSPTTDLAVLLADLEVVLGFSLDKGTELVVCRGDQPVGVDCDRARLELALYEILLDAQRDMPRGGHMELALELVERTSDAPAGTTVTAAGPSAVLTLTRPGPPSPRELELVQDFLAEEGVGFEQNEEPGGRSRVRLWLPRVASATQRARQPETTDPASAPDAPRQGRPERVLVVDDESIVRVVARKLLEHMGYRVEVAEGGKVALERFRADPAGVDLVILDVSMPDMAGCDCLRGLRALRADLPVILSSGFSREDVAERCPHDDGVAFVRKPYDLEQLQRVVADTLAGAQPGPSGASGESSG